MGGGLSEVVPSVAGLLDLILNVVGLLLWFNWRAAGIKTPAPGGISLAGTLQRIEALEPQRWFSFGCLVALLVIRPLLYCQIGSKVNWTARLDLTAITLPFRSDLLSRMYLYSTLSFLVALGVVYGSLLFLSVVNNPLRTTDHFTRQVHLQLGWIGRWYWPVRLLLTPALAALAWMAVSNLLVKLAIIPAPRNSAHAWQIAGLVAIASVLTWKYVVALFLGLHLLNTYVYLGNSSFWQFVTLTGNRLLWPVRWLPLRFGKVDLAPALILVAALVGAHFASVGLSGLYRRLPL
jgi:hypothetical protein